VMWMWWSGSFVSIWGDLSRRCVNFLGFRNAGYRLTVITSVLLPTRPPLGEQNAKCNQINQIGKIFHTHDPRYLPDYLEFWFIKWLADCHRDRVTRGIGVCRSASCPPEGTVRCAAY